MGNPKDFLPKIGTKLTNRYRLISVLGESLTSRVYKALDLALDLPICVKVFNSSIFKGEYRELNLLRIYRARAYQHDCLVKIFEFHEDQECTFLTSEIIEGISLRTLLDIHRETGEQFNLSKIRNIVQRIIEGLKFIHKLGVHGNVKPENVLILSKTLKLTDPYYLINEEILKSEEKPVSEYYRSPEQFKDPSEELKGSDVYSLALVIGELIGGNPVKPQIPLSEQIPLLSQRFDNIFLKSTALIPSERYSSINEMAKQLEKVFEIADAEGLWIRRYHETGVFKPMYRIEEEKEVEEEEIKDKFVPALLSEKEAEIIPEIEEKKEVEDVTAQIEEVPRQIEVKEEEALKESGEEKFEEGATLQLSTEEILEKLTPEELKEGVVVLHDETKVEKEEIKEEIIIEEKGEEEEKIEEKIEQPEPPIEAFEEETVVEKTQKVFPVEEIQEQEKIQVPLQEITEKEIMEVKIPPEISEEQKTESAEFVPVDESDVEVVAEGVGPEIMEGETTEEEKIEEVKEEEKEGEYVVVESIEGEGESEEIIELEEIAPEEISEIPEERKEEVAKLETKVIEGESLRVSVEEELTEQVAIAESEEASKIPPPQMIVKPTPSTKPFPFKSAIILLIVAALAGGLAAVIYLKLEMKKEFTPKPEDKGVLIEKKDIIVQQTVVKEEVEEKIFDEVTPSQLEEIVEEVEIGALEGEVSPVIEETTMAIKEEKTEAKLLKATDLVCPDGMKRIIKKSEIPYDPRVTPSDLGYCIDFFEYPGKGTMPKVNVTKGEASAICKKEGKRLCNNAEWRHACGGRYPYGSEFREGVCNTATSDGLEKPVMPAGSFPACKSPYGLYDMSGNVSEWTTNGSVAGGDGSKTPERCQCGNLPKRFESSKSPYVGFRCCSDPKFAK